jgi:4'-phosphopantetheinyl transferase
VIQEVSTTRLAPFWSPGPADLRLAPGEVHVWSAVLERPPEIVARDLAVLSDDERERAARMRSPHVRSELIHSRATLRTLLGRYLDCDPRRIRFRHGPQGKPELADCPGSSPLHFNVSHSHGVALFAITARGPVGVDVEQLRPFANDLGLAERYFSSAEFQALRALDGERRRLAFFHTWTRKEAFLKATGGGISFGLERVEVTILPDESSRVLRLDGDEGRAARWSLSSLTPLAGYVGALALEDRDFRLACWHVADEGEQRTA